MVMDYNWLRGRDDLVMKRGRSEALSGNVLIYGHLTNPRTSDDTRVVGSYVYSEQNELMQLFAAHMESTLDSSLNASLGTPPSRNALRLEQKAVKDDAEGLLLEALVWRINLASIKDVPEKQVDQLFLGDYVVLGKLNYALEAATGAYLRLFLDQSLDAERFHHPETARDFPSENASPIISTALPVAIVERYLDPLKADIENGFSNRARRTTQDFVRFSQDSEYQEIAEKLHLAVLSAEREIRKSAVSIVSTIVTLAMNGNQQHIPTHIVRLDGLLSENPLPRL